MSNEWLTQIYRGTGLPTPTVTEGKIIEWETDAPNPYEPLPVPLLDRVVYGCPKDLSLEQEASARLLEDEEDRLHRM